MFKCNPMKFIYCVFLLFLSVQLSYGQARHDVSGVVKDSTGQTLPGSTIKLLYGKDSVITATDINGGFAFKGIAASEFSLVFQSIGYQTLRRHYVVGNDTKPANLGAIILKAESKQLKSVTITAVTPVKIKEDTLEFNAGAYKVREGAPVEDMIKKMPGMDVDKDGNITAQGKSVTKVRINGKDFFGGDVKTATQNLPADIVQNVQVIDDYGDQANITGIKSGEPDKVLNITIRKDKNYGYFGQATVGDGHDEQPKTTPNQSNRYVASANVFSFDGDRQIAFLGNINNTNTNLFTFGSGGPGGGGPGGPPPGLSTTSNTNGITTARSFGLNYRDSWGKHITAYGSYSFADNSVYTTSTTLQTNTSLTNPTVNNLTNVQNDERKNHRFNFNIEWKPDTMNYFKFIPTVTYIDLATRLTSNSILSRNDTTLTNYNLNSYSTTSTPNYGLNVLYNHKFNNHGRNFSVSLNAGTTKLTEYQNPVYSYLAGVATAPLNQQISTRVKQDSVTAAVSYIEPIGKVSYLELNYAYHHDYTTADKETDTLTTNNVAYRYDLLSNNYNYTFTTNRIGLNYRVIQKKYNYLLGLGVLPAVLDGHNLATGVNTHTTTFNFAPTARVVYNVAKGQSFIFNYSGTSNQPTYTELQPVTDFSNASYPVQGNPDLKPEFNNVVRVGYNKFDFQSGNILFSNLTFTQTDNKIVANTITYPSVYTPNSKLAGTILTKYQNAGGYYSGSGFYIFEKPFDDRKIRLAFNGTATYANNISYISNVAPTTYDVTTEKNIAKALTLNQGVRLRYDVTDVIDVAFNGSYGLTYTDNSIKQANVNNNFQTVNLGLSGKHYLWKDWTVSYDYTKTIYEGYQGATNPNILNAYIERRFLKQHVATIRLSGFDLFNQNTGFTNSSTGSYITQTHANRLGRYALLSLTIRLQKFAGKRPGPGDGPPGGGFGPRGGGPPGGGPPPGGE